MPTADQIAGVSAYRAHSATLADAERQQLEAMTQIADIGAAIDGAVARGDDAAVGVLRGQLRAAEAARAHADGARSKATRATAGARSRALAGGAGFDLLSSQHPLLLLPLRLETRFAWLHAGDWTFEETAGAPKALLVRIYPDEIHDDSHEPELTAGEHQLMDELEKRLVAARDVQQLDVAWADAIRRVGATRAGWIGENIARHRAAGRRPGRLSRPSVARLMPDRFVAFAELQDGNVLVEQSEPVREPLETGPSPDGMRWMTDFTDALHAGMALVIPNLADDVTEIVRLTVVGARGTLDPAATADAVEQLLDAHHYTGGLSLVANGAPTNSLPGARAAYNANLRPEDLITLERRRFQIGMRSSPLCSPGDETDGSQLAAALGINTRAFAFVHGADATDWRIARTIRLLLATATRRHLTDLLDGGILDPDQLAEVIEAGVEFADASGPLPALRVGSQPYGILPVLVRDDARLPADSFTARALAVLDALRERWERAAATLRWIGNPGSDPGATLIRMLQRDAVARSIGFRPLLGPQLAAEVLRATPSATVARQRAAAAAAIDAIGARDASRSTLLQALHLGFAPRLTAPLVEALDPIQGSPQQLAQFLELAASLRPDRLLLHDYSGAERPRSLLYALARLAMLERADEQARAALIAAGGDSSGWDAENVRGITADPLGTPLRRLEAPDPIDPLETIAFHLSEQGRDAAILGDLRAMLRWLASRPTTAIEESLRASLGLFSHRLDPWYTGFATSRLRELRANPAIANGLNVGGYGIVERIRVAPRRPAAGVSDLFINPLNGGYTHAPSVGHGAAAAVLRSAHLAHAAAGNGEAFSIDLSSERVRAGLDLLQGIRTGQPLAALLGYRIERALADGKLQHLIAPLRAAAPLVANRLTLGTEPAETVAATNVVDGLSVLEDAGYDGAALPSADTLLTRHPSLPMQVDEHDGVNAALGAAADALDAVADLAIAESVYQAVQGNPVRAGATVDGLSGAPVPPPEIAVVRSPRTGVGVTHRLLVLLGSESGRNGWFSTPRAAAEPRLDAWARTALPAPDDILLRARFVDPDGTVTGTFDNLSLRALNQKALDLGVKQLAVGALDLVVQGEPHDTPFGSPLELRLAALVELMRPEAVGDSELQLVFGRGAGWGPQEFGVVETLEIARQLRETLGRTRPLAPEDLVSPGRAPTMAVDTGELAHRAVAAADTLANVIADLDEVANSSDASAIRAALFWADQFGVPGATPNTIRDPVGATDVDVKERVRRRAGLQQQALAALAELRRRQAAEVDLAPSDSIGRLQLAFGSGFVVLASFSPSSDAVAAFTPAMAPAGADPAALRAWLARAAPVREAVAALDCALAYADALAAVDAAAPVATLWVGQLGSSPSERWVGLESLAGSTIQGGRVSLVAMTPSADLPTGAIAGLMVDEWSEVVPSTHETTSVTFHYEAPTATAPQVLLLGVPPEGREAWTVDDAVTMATEALALAQIRLVDLDDIPDLGQILPAFVTAENPAGDSIGLDVEFLTEPLP
jgi:hypothetical protein